MTRRNTPRQTAPAAAAELRLKAEDSLAQLSEGKTADDPARLLHELQVHQVELEMQNLELRRSEDALSASDERMRLAMLATNDVIWDWDVASDQQTWTALRAPSSAGPTSSNGRRPRRGGWSASMPVTASAWCAASMRRSAIRDVPTGKTNTASCTSMGTTARCMTAPPYCVTLPARPCAWSVPCRT
jgi:hypothetical protein